MRIFYYNDIFKKLKFIIIDTFAPMGAFASNQNMGSFQDVLR